MYFILKKMSIPKFADFKKLRISFCNGSFAVNVLEKATLNKANRTVKI